MLQNYIFKQYETHFIANNNNNMKRTIQSRKCIKKENEHNFITQ
jgi:hypothetical protein